MAKKSRFIFSGLMGWAAGAAAVLAQGTSAAPPEFDEGNFTSFSFITDNDVYFQLGENQDRNYTAGFGFQFNGSFVRRAGLVRPLLALDRLVGIDRWRTPDFDHHYHSFLFFGTGFTPDKLNESAPIRDDRPYGSITGFSVRRLSVKSATLDEAWSSELVVGALGLYAAREIQTKIHREIRRGSDIEPYDPLGWHNQISDGGEPTALYRVGYESRLAGGESGHDVRKHWQVSGGWQLNAGYYTNATASLSARLGAFNSDFWEFTPSAMNIGTQNAGTRSPPPGYEAFLFAGLRPRVILYNALLEGQFKDSVYTVTPKRLQLEWDFGVAVFCRKPFFFFPNTQLEVIWNAYAGRSAEFIGRQARTHTWGSFSFVFSRAQ